MILNGIESHGNSKWSKSKCFETMLALVSVPATTDLILNGLVSYSNSNVCKTKCVQNKMRAKQYEATSVSIWLDLLVGLCWYFEFISTLLGG